MSGLQYSLVGNGDEQFVTVFVPGDTPKVAQSSHPNFTQIVNRALEGDVSVVELFDLASTIAARFDSLSERVSVANGRVYFDGDEIHSALTKQILRCLEYDDDALTAFVNFFENVQNNPNAHSREQLYEWLDRHDFTITTDGMIVGYKGVRVTDDGFVSISHGPAVVDGEPVNGAVPNYVGAIVEMPRSNVVHDPGVGCSVGLHVGTWDYASGFAQGAVLEVVVNPRDVVSVPTDCNWAKVRCCRYEVTDVIDHPHSAPVLDVDGGREDDDHFNVQLWFDDGDDYEDYEF